MRYFFPIHLDSGNRGCEAIAKGTSILLKEPMDNLLGLCRNIPLDKSMGLDKFVKLIPVESMIPHKIYNRIIHYLHLPLKKIEINPFDRFVHRMTKNDILVSTGGDMMCYGNNQVITTNNYAHGIGCITILWGCSMGPENLTPEKEDTLRKFSLVYARESLSFDFFKSIGLNNVCLYPDPAFVLEPEKCSLPSIFKEGEVIGVNLSNYVLGDFSLDTPFGKQVTQTLDYIIENTSYNVLLVPHVTWNNKHEKQDDRVVASVVMEKYGVTNRFSVLNIDRLNYCQIRYIISKCKLFMGGRTHAVISAYSTCVPTIALGYSIKSKGIAKDLGLPVELVVDSKNANGSCGLLDSFLYLNSNKTTIREHLLNVMPEYIRRTYGIREEMGLLISE